MVNKKSKKSQSAIISTVLLIMIVVIAAGIIIAFVVPFVRDKLSGGDCLAIAGEVSITNNLKYTCYDANLDRMRVQIHYGDIENLTKGFQIIVDSSGQSKSFDITSASVTDVLMLNNDTVLVFPGKNQERTYQLEGIDSVPEDVKVYPVLKNGKTCEASDNLVSISAC